MPKQLIKFLTAERFPARCWVILRLETLDPESAFADVIELSEAVVHFAVPKNHQGLAERCQQSVLSLRRSRVSLWEASHVVPVLDSPRLRTSIGIIRPHVRRSMLASGRKSSGYFSRSVSLGDIIPKAVQ